MNRDSQRWVPFAYGFRPFFFVAGVYAAVALGAWLVIYASGSAPLAGLPPQYWHAHEMLFGFVAAAVAGFMLTAVPSWTGGRGFAGWPLKILVLLWLTGRLAFALAATLPVVLLAILELAFIPALILTIAPSLLRAPSRNTPLLLVLLVFWASDLVFMLGVAYQDVAMSARGLRGGLDLVLVLITVIGGRIVPAFTGNALRARAVTVTLRASPLLERLTISAMLAYAIADVTAPMHGLTGTIAALAGVAQALRLAGWQGVRTLSQPIVWVLHLGYLWLPVGLFLKALYVLGDVGWAVHFQHALGAGAAGTMILAVMTRASLGHTGRPLQVRRIVTLAYVLLTGGVAVRVFGPALLPGSYLATVVTAGALWVIAFALFVYAYAPVLLRPRVDGKPG
jgi:uncharacterized protein involved in response to NO